MVKEKRDIAMFGCTGAVRELMRGGTASLAGLGAGSVAKPFFIMSSSTTTGEHDEVRTIFVEPAQAKGAGTVWLQFGPSASNFPSRVTAALPGDGPAKLVCDCVIWLGGADARALLVPVDPRQDFHLAIGHDGLERRPGRPAAFLGAGIAAAKARLARLARGRAAEGGMMHFRV